MLAVALGTLGMSYAAVPLYRMFCQATGFGGTVKRHAGSGEEEGYDLPKDPASLPGNRPLRVSFVTNVSGSLQWSFKPVQKHVEVMAGQTSLAFFEATNHSSEPIIGVATYNVVPNEVSRPEDRAQPRALSGLGDGESVHMRHPSPPPHPLQPMLPLCPWAGGRLLQQDTVLLL
jgi:cytochrome c oxidase assembly protein subunit 11